MKLVNSYFKKEEERKHLNSVCVSAVSRSVLSNCVEPLFVKQCFCQWRKVT